MGTSPSAYCADEGSLLSLASTHIIPHFEHLSAGRYYPPGSPLFLDYRYSVPQDARALLVVVGGYTQFSGLWAELVWDLKDEPLGVFLFDHRGQGFSDRYPGVLHTHVNSFQEYVDDMKALMESVVVPLAERRPIYILAHSMGGCIATLYLQQNPQRVAKALLAAPMMLLSTGAFPSAFARLVASGAEVFLPKAPVSTLTHYLMWTDETPAQRNTQSPARHRFKRDLYLRFPWASVGGATFGWLKAGFESHTQLFAHAKELEVPIHILQAVQEKPVVENSAQRAFCDLAPQCTLETLDGRHELFNESDPVRNRALGVLKAMVSSPGSALSQ